MPLLRWKLYFSLVAIFLINISSCSTLQKKTKSFEGIASYYHKNFQGKKTASGETYKNEELTCAHRFLPFGTYLKVTYLKTNKSIIVRVNDRGPFVKSRVIDLSYQAAKSIGIISDGIGKVQVQIVSHTST